MFKGFQTVFFGGIGIAEHQVVSDRAHYHDWLLTDIPDVFSETLEVDRLDVLAVKVDCATSRIVEPLDQLNYSRFAAARWSNDGSGLTSFNAECGIDQNWFVLRRGCRIFESHFSKIYGFD